MRTKFLVLVFVFVGTLLSLDALAAERKVAAEAAMMARVQGDAPGIASARIVDGSLLRAETAGARVEGAFRYTPVQVSEANAYDAVGVGYLEVHAPDGRLLRYEYQRHVVHDNGDWTWIGRLDGEPLRDAVITFGAEAVYGTLSRGEEAPMRITKRNGQLWLMEVRPGQTPKVPRGKDVRMPPAERKPTGSPSSKSDGRTPTSAKAQIEGETPITAAAVGIPTVDVMVAYTTGFKNAPEQGSTAAAVTRINSMVALTNQAYANSQIDAEVRLVHTVEVGYTDTTSNGLALNEITGYDENDGAVVIPASLSQIRLLRSKHGADLVSLVRDFQDPEHDGCGVAWLNGALGAEYDNANEAGKRGIIDDASSSGYSVVSDGSDGGFFCLDSTFAHELGHNMGSQHDVANAGDPPSEGAYPYSFGWKQNSPAFATIMAYSDPGQAELNFFSNPNITSCQGVPCGTASADNARSLNRTMARVAQFLTTRTAGTGIGVQNAPADRGFFDLEVRGLTALPNARLAGTPLMRPEAYSLSVPVDPTPIDSGEPYSNSDGSTFKNFTVPATPSGASRQYRIVTRAISETASDIDLYVGTGSTPSFVTEQCRGFSDRADESCEVTITRSAGAAAETWWVLVHNYGSSNASDVIQFDVAVVPLVADNKTLVVTGPGHAVADETFDMRVNWDDPGFLPNESRLGYALIYSQPGTLASTVPIRLTRTGTAPAAYALQNGVARTLRVPGSSTNSGAHDRLYFEVPPQASQVTFTVSGSGAVELYAVRDDTPSTPTIDPAPNWQSSSFKVTGGSVEKTLVVNNLDLGTGRWYLVPRNTSGNAAQVSVKAEVTQTLTLSIFRSGHYNNQQRDGHGAFIDFAGPIGNPDQWVIVWYTYLQDGTPTWYYTQGAVPGPAGIWRGELFRVTWNGSAASATDVGDLIITETGPTSLTFSYNLDGQSGSEKFNRISDGSCPLFNGTQLDVTGHWYSPSKSGFGYSYQVSGGSNPQEVFIPYIYDGQGFPRWVYGQKAFSGGVNSLSLQWFDGFCPLCAHQSLISTSAGTGTRTLSTNNVTNMSANVNFTGALSGSWNESLPVALLSQRKNCQ